MLFMIIVNVFADSVCPDPFVRTFTRTGQQNPWNVRMFADNLRFSAHLTLRRVEIVLRNVLSFFRHMSRLLESYDMGGCLCLNFFAPSKQHKSGHVQNSLLRNMWLNNLLGRVWMGESRRRGAVEIFHSKGTCLLSRFYRVSKNKNFTDHQWKCQDMNVIYSMIFLGQLPS